MFAIRPYWLKSDTSLTEGEESSSKVWNNMYAMPDTYERKWLGDFQSGTSLLEGALTATDLGYRLYFDNDYKITEETKSEQDVIKFLKKYNQKIANFGHLYAYKLKSKRLQNLDELFQSGESFLDELHDQGFDMKKVSRVLSLGAEFFFDRRYD